MLTAVVVISAFFGLLAPALAAAGECPNEARRSEQGADALSLPECRAYELVTPPDKGQAEARPSGRNPVSERKAEVEPLATNDLPGVRAAHADTAGLRFAWIPSAPLPGDGSLSPSHLATRGTNGWSSQSPVPPMSSAADLGCWELAGVSGWSLDLSKGVLDLPAGPRAPESPTGGYFQNEGECGHDEPRLVAGEPEHFRNLFVHNDLTGTNELVNITPAGVTWPEPVVSFQGYFGASFLAGAEDFSHIVFSEELNLTPDAPVGYPGGDELYEWSEGKVSLVSILPSGTPVHGRLADATREEGGKKVFNLSTHQFELVESKNDPGPNIAQFRNALSADGSRVFFEAEGNLYVRLNPMQPPSALDGGGKCEAEKACTLQLDLTQGGTGQSGGGRFMLASAAGNRAFFTDESRLTTDSNAASGSPDLYEWRSEGVIGCAKSEGCLTDLTPATASEPASVLGVSGASAGGSLVYFVAKGVLTEETNSKGDSAETGKPNLYLRSGGTTSFIATLNTADECDWVWNVHCVPAEDGGLTARTSIDGNFLAFNSIRSLTDHYNNVSTVTGTPVLEIYLYDATSKELACVSCMPDGSRPRFGAAIEIPARQPNDEWYNSYPQHNVSDRGQVFFETTDALLPRDVNGRRDVYEYQGGAVHLLSTGTSEAGSHFLDATPDGSNAFISTAQSLVPRDVDSVYDYYDVRVDGGFPEPVPPPPGCEDEACRGTGTSGEPLSAGSAAFEGSGNPLRRLRCAKHFVRRHGRCRKSHRRHKHRRRAARLGRSIGK